MKKVNPDSYKQALKWIVGILKKNRIQFNVLGGLAAYAYGSRRMLIDIDLSMSRKNMEKLSKLTERYVVEFPWDIASSTSLWKGYYMELNYKGIAIEIGESENTQYLNKKTKKWERFPAGLRESVTKKVLGVNVPVMPKNNLISYKSKLMRKVDVIDLKNLN